MKKLLSGSMVLVVALFAWQALAEEGRAVAPMPTHSSKDKMQELQQKKKELKTETKEKRSEIKEEMKDKKMEIRKDLRKVKDEGKRSAAEKISEELIALNEKRLKQFSRSLDELERVWSNTSERANKKAGKGFDVTSVNTAIEQAKADVAAARAAIEAQKGKVYKVEAATDGALKEAIKTVRKSLEIDLKAVQDLVKKARESTHKAATTLAKLRKEKKVSPSPSPSVSVSASPTPTSTPSVSPANQ